MVPHCACVASRVGFVQVAGVAGEGGCCGALTGLIGIAGDGVACLGAGDAGGKDDRSVG